MKRLFDFSAALFALIILAPFLMAVAVLVQATLGSPVLFSQDRPGREGRIFTIWKFRTMTNDVNPEKRSLSDGERLTSVGRALRATSIDELPELWNVLKGEMSLVGPRPLLVSYLPLYSKVQARRHEVRPGITGWAQVNGRNGLSWEEKFRLDVWYVDNRTFWLDIRILALTVVRVFQRDGISAAGQATMQEFTGSGSFGRRKTEDVFNEPD